ncbi:MAG: polysaccharide deacetylase family protein, partial [Clostridia bacterium]|nr:polysaccharide deacetylase family protein [Clostridia bacterium]
VPTPTPTPRPQNGRRVIYLTFDDGPCEYTPEVLDILARYNAKATFFTVGYFVNWYPEITRMIMNSDNLLACHTYSHDFNIIYASPEAFMNDVHRWEEVVQRACGRLPERICVRFPGGTTTASAIPVRDAIMRLLRAGGYRWFDWNAGDNDKWPGGNVNHLPEEEYFLWSYYETIGWFENRPDEPVIFLMHDTERGSVNILPRILEDLINRGYTFDTLDHHPDWNN